MRKTKIVCTLGPACDNRKTVMAMIKAGMNVARFNFSHGNYEEQLARINLVKSLRDELNVPIALMLDTKGPEIRIKTFETGRITLKEGQDFALTIKDVVGTDKIVSVSYDKFTKVIRTGMTILINDGLIELKAASVDEDTVNCIVITGGELTNRKSINVPNVPIDMPYVSDIDKQDILFGIANNIDLIAISFARTADDVKEIRKILCDNNGCDVDIIAKIENMQGVNNIEEIIEASDGVMVARGDLGVELPYEVLPKIQKKIIQMVYRAGKKVITATQMLESMVHNPRPTRAEVSDVANAAYDGTSATMLSGETASGKYPVESVRTMAKVLVDMEDSIDYRQRFSAHDVTHASVPGAIGDAVCSAAYDLNAKAILVYTSSGSSARLVSSFRPKFPIYAFTPNRRVYYKLALSWGITPLVMENHKDIEVMIRKSINKLIELNYISKGDLVCIVAGFPLEVSGTTNFLRIEYA